MKAALIIRDAAIFVAVLFGAAHVGAVAANLMAGLGRIPVSRVSLALSNLTAVLWGLATLITLLAHLVLFQCGKAAR